MIHKRIVTDPQKDRKRRYAYRMDETIARSVLSANLKAAMNRPNRPPIGQQELARRAKRAGAKLSQSTINRILNCEVGCGIDQLVILSVLLGVEPWQLLVPGMNPDDPPVLTVISRQLEEFQSSLKAQADRISALQHALKPDR